VFGIKYIANNKNVLFLEVILQVIAIRSELWFFDDDLKHTILSVNYLNVACLFRILRLLYLLIEIR